MEEIERQVRKVGRPRKDEGRVVEKSTRPTRSSTGGWKQKLPVKWVDPAYHYRWAFSESEDGYRIQELLAEGYEFASATEHSFGESQVYKTGSEGSSVTRCPAGKSGGYLYLMRIRKEWYKEIMDEKRRRILDTEKSNERNYKSLHGDGAYGTIKIDHGR